MHPRAPAISPGRYDVGMRLPILVLSAASVILGQGTTQTASMPNPYGPTTRAATRPTSQTTARPRTPFRRPFIGFGGFNTHEVIVVEREAPPKDEPLKNLIISPVYQRDKITPKMIEIP